MIQQGLLSAKELSSYLGVSPCTIYRLVKKNEIPLIRSAGIGLRFKKDAIDEWLEKNSSKPIADSETLKPTLTLPTETSIRLSHGNSGGKGEMAKANCKTRQNFGIGAIYVRKSRSGAPRYYLDYSDGGKRIQRVCRKAASFEDAYYELRRAVLREPDRKRVTFSNFANEYLEDYAKPSKKSWEADRDRLKKLKKHLKEMDLRQITPMEIERFRSSLLIAGRKKSTTNRYLALLKRMFNLAIEEGYMEANPARKVRLFSEADNLKERILTEEEEKRLIESCCDHMRQIVTFALNTGMRLGEILNLRWANVDLNSGTIKVEFTKSGKTRIVPINETLKEMLSRPRKKGEEYVFTNPDTKDRFRETKRSYKTGCRKAGIEGLRFHDLRHTFASRLIKNGVDVGTVRKLLGHSTLLITQRYIHTDEQTMRMAVGSLVKMGNLLHQCDTGSFKKSEGKIETPVTSFLSMN